MLLSEKLYFLMPKGSAEMVELVESTHADTSRVKAKRRSPAEHLRTIFAAYGEGESTVTLQEIPFQTMVGIRVDADSEAAARIVSVVGALPDRCGQVTVGAGGASILWLGPDEFLVVAPEEDSAGTVASAAISAMADGAGQVIDLSSNRTTFRLSGPSARAVLEKSCAADLHPRQFPAGMAITTVIGIVPTILWKTGDDSFLILPRASFADYLGRWLLDGMLEFAPSAGPAWH